MRTPETQNQALENKTDHLETRSIREKLLFHGIPDIPNENCETLVQEFLKDTINIAEYIKLYRANRLGKLRVTIDLLSLNFTAIKTVSWSEQQHRPNQTN